MYRYFLFLMLAFASCGGTTGHIVFYDFDTPKNNVEKDIVQVINQGGYTVPEKWKSHTNDEYFERIYVYFSDYPEELYQVGFTDKADWAKSPISRLGLISIYQGNQFQYEVNLNSKEKQRIQKRFEDKILSKIEYAYKKNN